MNEDVLSRTFDKYIASAKQAEEKGFYKKAKADYLEAAKVMLKLAKDSSEKLKAARVERSKRLISYAEGLPEELPRKAVEPKYKTSGSGAGADKTDGEDSSAQFSAATIPDIGFDDVAGLNDVKDAVRIKMIYPLLHPELYTALGKSTGGGVLLYGPPGTGKTMMAKAIAHEVGAKFYAVKCSDIVSKWVGESERNIAALFETARSADRAIIFFDELDSLFYRRGKDTHNDQRVNELLQQIDGFSGQTGNILLLGATNNPWSVDDAAMRPGRFSQKIYVSLPDAPAREFLIKKSLAKISGGEDIDEMSIVEATEGFSGADIKELFDRATDYPLQRSLKTGEVSRLTASDVQSALRRVRPSVSEQVLERFADYQRENG